MTDQRQAETDADQPTPVETGYQWLDDRTDAAIKRFKSIKLSDTSPLIADDQYFQPINRNFRQNTEQCLLVALDHLRFLAWSLKNREKPYPYAQSTLIRTATTAAATALWMISAPSASERRQRALEFSFNDLKAARGWMDTAASDPKNVQEMGSEHTRFVARRVEIERRLDWIVQEANTLLSPECPYTRSRYSGSTTSDTDIVKFAGAATPQIGSGGWNPEIVLSQSWQLLSGYAHARPWAPIHSGSFQVADPTPDPRTGTIEVAPVGDPNMLLDFAFRALVVTENAISLLEQLSNQ